MDAEDQMPVSDAHGVTDEIQKVALKVCLNIHRKKRREPWLMGIIAALVCVPGSIYLDIPKDELRWAMGVGGPVGFWGVWWLIGKRFFSQESFLVRGKVTKTFKAKMFYHVTLSTSAYWQGPSSRQPFSPREGLDEVVLTIELPDYAPDEGDSVVFLSPGKGEAIMLELNGQFLMPEKHL